MCGCVSVCASQCVCGWVGVGVDWNVSRKMWVIDSCIGQDKSS